MHWLVWQGRLLTRHLTGSTQDRSGWPTDAIIEAQSLPTNATLGSILYNEEKDWEAEGITTHWMHRARRKLTSSSVHCTSLTGNIVPTWHAIGSKKNGSRWLSPDGQKVIARTILLTTLWFGTPDISLISNPAETRSGRKVLQTMVWTQHSTGVWGVVSQELSLCRPWRKPSTWAQVWNFLKGVAQVTSNE